MKSIIPGIPQSTLHQLNSSQLSRKGQWDFPGSHMKFGNDEYELLSPLPELEQLDLDELSSGPLRKPNDIQMTFLEIHEYLDKNELKNRLEWLDSRCSAKNPDNVENICINGGIQIKNDCLVETNEYFKCTELGTRYPKLRSLQLQKLNLRQIHPGFWNCFDGSKLRQINLSENNLVEISVQSHQLPELEHLNLSKNDISTLSFLRNGKASFCKLKTFDISDNKIERLDDLADLRKIFSSEFTHLRLRGNPCMETTGDSKNSEKLLKKLVLTLRQAGINGRKVFLDDLNFCVLEQKLIVTSLQKKYTDVKKKLSITQVKLLALKSQQVETTSDSKSDQSLIQRLKKELAEQKSLFSKERKSYFAQFKEMEKKYLTCQSEKLEKEKQLMQNKYILENRYREKESINSSKDTGIQLELTKIRDQIDYFRNSADKSSENQKLVHRIQDLEKRNSSLTSELHQLSTAAKSSLSGLKRKLKDQEVKNSSLKKMLEQKSKETFEMKSMLKERTEQIGKLSKSLEESMSTIGKKEESVRKAVTNIENLRSVLHKIQTDTSNSNEKLKKKNLKLFQELSATKAKLKEISLISDAREAELMEDLRKKHSSVQILNAKYKHLRTEFQNAKVYQSKVEQLKTERNTANEKIKALQAFLQATKQKFLSVRKKLTQAKGNHENLTKEHEIQLGELKKEIESMKKTGKQNIECTIKEKEKMQKENSVLTLRIADNISQIETLKEQIKSKVVLVEEAKEELELIRRELHEEKKENHDLKKKLTKSIDKIEQKKQKLKEFQSVIEQNMDLVKNYKKHIVELKLAKKEKVQQENEIKSLGEQIATALGEKKKIEQQLANVENERDSLKTELTARTQEQEFKIQSRIDQAKQAIEQEKLQAINQNEMIHRQQMAKLKSDARVVIENITKELQLSKRKLKMTGEFVKQFQVNSTKLMQQAQSI